MLIIDDGSELDMILDTTKFDDYELIDIAMESEDSLHELTGIGMAPASDTPGMSGLAPRKGSSRELCPGVESCQGILCLLPSMHVHIHVRTCSNIP